MAVYGDMLSYFPELMLPATYFTMKPKIVAGYEERIVLKTVKGHFQTLKQGDLVDKGETLNNKEILTFWTREKLDITNFLTIQNVDYRIKNTFDWRFAGNFFVYEVEQLQSLTDIQEPTDFTTGVEAYL